MKTGQWDDIVGDEQHWLTLHRFRFASRISATKRSFDGPARAEVWRFCPYQELDDQGLPSFQSDVWGGLGLFSNRADAEAVVNDPGAYLSWDDEAVESGHALLSPIAHHGVVNFRGTEEDGTAIRAGEKSKTGPMVVITTAGFVTRDVPRVQRFLKGVAEIVDFYGTLPGNLFRSVFNGGFDGKDGFTATIWQDDKSMINAAYQDGVHKAWMEQSKNGALFDRSSFTRARLIESTGTWAGATL